MCVFMLGDMWVGAFHSMFSCLCFSDSHNIYICMRISAWESVVGVVLIIHNGGKCVVQ